ncbi:SRPBCC family protein [Nocardioides iriomotensis]|uniref:SRPBCC family protein n=1 Tax=Nocardioides iriomotensis TaxID=715784 RepID=A0A4Q5IXS7_9ACTN|nr:SRPBCC family protein [Nocardioides iriomotensis]RYU10977.1 SRPBCC family protein [Nocardioides iriomotensis]
MTLDNPLDQLGAVDRALSTREHLGRTARVLTAEQHYPTDADDLWEALTTPERLQRWFLPLEGDLRVGGSYQLVGNAGGTIERCDAPRSFAITWEYGGGVSWVEVDLTPTDGGTDLVLTHIAHVDGFAETYGPGAVGVGWDMTLMGLHAHVVSGEANDPSAFEAWGTSDEGKAYVTRSSELWGQADAADGTDPAVAQARAERTAAFYRGEEVPQVQPQDG